jgi:hypothetical protein
MVYSGDMSKDGWAAQQAVTIGEEIRQLRGGRSGQWLSDRTAALGYRVTRTTISELENHKRKYVTTAELMVLARALNTTPIALLYPRPLSGDSIEMLPGSKASKTVALQWFSGEVDVPSPWVCDNPDEYRANLEPVEAARKVSELEQQKFTLMKVFSGRSEDKWDEASNVVPEISRIQREIDRLRGTDGG